MAGSAKNKPEIETGNLYGFIWDQFHEAQWKQFSDDHFEKWSPLPVDALEFIRGRICLDAGCGSGRAVRSMLLAKAAKVYAIDLGRGCVRNTINRNNDFADGLETEIGSVLDLPYRNATFDFVHCDGVLHHTLDPLKGFSELVRVLKPGGKIVIAVYGRGGLMNFAIYFVRMFRKVIPQKVSFSLCRLISNNPVNWYAIMDCMYVPLRKNYYEFEIRKWLENVNLKNITRLDSIWGPYRYGKWMKGDGYLKFIADKPL